jgi:plastocyanin
VYIHRTVRFCLLVSLAINAGAASAAPPVAQQIVIEGVKFTPELATIKSGDWVQWINKDPFPHTVTSPGEFDSHNIPAGGTWKHRVIKVGQLSYICTLHPNMKATLSVTN